jgi:hypothetical protein
MELKIYKRMVKVWRTRGRVAQANKLAETIEAYEDSKIGKNELSRVFLQLNTK